MRRPDMLRPMVRRPAVAIIGPGRLGTSLVINLERAGYRVVEIVSSRKAVSLRKGSHLARIVGAKRTTVSTAQLDADVIWFCVPDGKIGSIAHEFGSAIHWEEKIVFHSSGALTSDALDSLRRLGASVASVHPMMTFVHGAVPQLRGVPFGLEGDTRATKAAMQIVRALGASPFKIKKKDKVLYHAWGTFLSPLLVASLVTAEKVARAAGMSAVGARQKMLPIVRQTLANYAKLGPKNAFSGPIVRGDADILQRHLKALEGIPDAVEVYASLARAALRYLPWRNKRDLKKAIARRAGR